MEEYHICKKMFTLDYQERNYVILGSLNIKSNLNLENINFLIQKINSYVNIQLFET